MAKRNMEKDSRDGLESEISILRCVWYWPGTGTGEKDEMVTLERAKGKAHNGKDSEKERYWHLLSEIDFFLLSNTIRSCRSLKVSDICLISTLAHQTYLLGMRCSILCSTH